MHDIIRLFLTMTLSKHKTFTYRLTSIFKHQYSHSFYSNCICRSVGLALSLLRLELFISMHFSPANVCDVYLQIVLDELKRHEIEAARLENVMLDLSTDVDTQKISAQLAGLKTKIVTLLAEAEKGITTIEVRNTLLLKV